MKILALIPARGGSKRLPRKNILPLGGKPLIVWSIDVAKDIPEICDILVSTDDPEIADISKNAGALVPWLRPVELATDTATSVDVALHALEWYEKEKSKVDGLLLLQPTSPFRKKETLMKGINLFLENHGIYSITSVSPVVQHPNWCFTITDSKLSPLLGWENLKKRSQDLPKAWALNGSIYLISSILLHQKKSFLTEETLPIIIENITESIDIDNKEDWQKAEIIIKQSYLSQAAIKPC